MFRQGLKSKILNLTIGLTLLGFGVLVFLVIKEEEKSLLRERMKASELMAQPILHTIYKDMLDERADMPRFLIEGLKTIKGVERVQLIRANGVEEAFKDYKTLNSVKVEFGEIKPEWVVEHPNLLNNVAHGTQNQEFKKALQEFNIGKKEAVFYIEKEGERSFFTYLVPIVSRPKCSSCHSHEEAARGVLMISTSLDDMYGLLNSSRNRWIMYGLITVAATTVLLGLLVSGVVTRPVDRTVDMLKAIAEGKGDLTQRLEISSNDEIGMLGRWFNKFVEGMQHMVKEIFTISREVSSASREIESSSREIIEAVGKQLRAAEDTSVSIKEMDASIKTVAEEAESLNISSIEVSDSAHTMSSSVDEVKVNIEKLFYSASSTTSSINEMAISINQVASHVDELFKKTEEVVSSIIEIGTKVKEVENYSRSQAELAEKVRADAEDVGMDSVVKTREGIEKVSLEVASTGLVINRLGERSKEIGKILTVINDIADNTHLLALNATILAAQAGEHGKGFAVVARQVKDLATKTTSSTKEIAELINVVQSEVSVAVESMQRSSEKVEDGVRLSRDAQDALKMILDSARSSFDMAKMIEKTTIEQTKGAGQITNAAQMISHMVGDIKNAANEQSSAAKEILKDTVQMKEFMEKVKLSTIEQSREGKHVSEAIFKVADKIKRVAGATQEQMKFSKRIVVAVETVTKAAEDNAALATRLEKTVKEMNKQAETLRSTVGSFKT
ncbi:MAG: HAMP domain-containing protein [Deltaproteobacteria bacterium]|nr:HAMP domain-containing protein [Deltaproteobacteria bacterium]